MSKQTVQTGAGGPRRFSLRDSIAYCFGDMGCSLSFGLKGTMAIFWTQYMGMDLWYSLLLLIVQVWDAIDDAMIGAIIDADKHTYKRNKFMQYIFVGSIGLIFGSACCFMPFPGAPVWAKGIIYVVGYVIWDAFFTIAYVPLGSVLSLISDDPGDRASLSAWRGIGSLVANMLPMVFLPYLIYDESNNLVGERVFLVALVMGVIGFVFFQIFLKNTVIRVELEAPAPDAAPKFNLVRSLGNFFRNRAAVGATIAAVGLFLGQMGAQTAIMVMFQAYFKNAQISGVVSMFSMIPTLMFTPVIRKLVLRFGKKELVIAGSLGSCVICVLMLVLPITPDARGLAIYMVCMLLNSVCLGLYNSVTWGLMGDAIDYNEWKGRPREEGTTFALHSFFRKVAQGVGPSLALVVMVALGYEGTLGAAQSAQVALNMRYLVPCMYLLSAVLLFVGMGLVYNLDKKTLARMTEELQAQHNA